MLTGGLGMRYIIYLITMTNTIKLVNDNISIIKENIDINCMC